MHQDFQDTYPSHYHGMDDAPEPELPKSTRVFWKIVPVGIVLLLLLLWFRH